MGLNQQLKINLQEWGFWHLRKSQVRPCMLCQGGSAVSPARSGQVTGRGDSCGCHHAWTAPRLCCTTPCQNPWHTGVRHHSSVLISLPGFLAPGIVGLRLSSFRGLWYVPTSPLQHLLGQHSQPEHSMFFPASIPSHSLQFWLLWGWLGPCQVLAPRPALVWLCHGLCSSPGGAESLDKATKVPFHDGMGCSICPSRCLHRGVAARPRVAAWRALPAQGLAVAMDLQPLL